MPSKYLGRAIVACLVALTPFGAAAQRSGAAKPAPAAVPQKTSTTSAKLPPLSYVCPMVQDAEVLEDKPGKCPKCGMQLQPIRLDLRYACPVHQTYIQTTQGKHPYDGRELVPVTVSIVWTCGEEKFLDPGKCSDGSARAEKYEQRPHGDHNPKHGGQFFMAPDAWHHLEGTYPSAGLFRMYFYNDYSKPMKPTGFTASISLLDANDKDTGVTIPLKPGRISNTLEAALPKDGATLPLRVLARVKFTATGDASPFNFTFSETTKEPAATPPPAVTTSNAPAAPAAASAASKPAAQQPPPAPAPPAPAPAVDLSGAPAALLTALDEDILPKTMQGLIAELSKRATEVEQTVKDGNLGQVWLPAMGTKTVALALESHASMLPERQRALANVAIKRVVTAAWALDAYGDLGNKEKMTEAYEKLASAVADLKTAYGSR
jgi:hypothetical protein